MTDNIANWLGQQLDEDERIARATHPVFLHWEYDDCVKEIRDFGNGNTLATGVLPHYGAFMHEHDPARVLREIDAKRQILRDLEQAEFTLSKSQPGTAPHDLMTGAVNYLRRVVRHHAAVYSDRSGYLPEWRP